MTLGGTLGGLQGVHLGLGGDFNLDVGGEVALAGGPLLGGDGVARAELLAFEFANAIAAAALFNDGLNRNAVHFNTGFGLDGVLKNFAHRNPPSHSPSMAGLVSTIGTRIIVL